MADAEQSIPDIYREAAEEVRQLSLRARLTDIRGDLLELSARFERLAAYADAAISLGVPGYPHGERLPVADDRSDRARAADRPLSSDSGPHTESAVSAFLVVLSGCGLGMGRDVRAYNTCRARHPEDAVVCEGPRQAYEVDPTIVQARLAGGAATAAHGYEQGSAPSSPPPPTPLHPSPMTATSGPNGQAHWLAPASRRVEAGPLWSAVLAALVMLGALVPGGTQVKCNQQCDAGYSADEDDCRHQYGTPADTDALAHCIREAREDYRNCLDDCAGAEISLPRWRILVAAAPTTTVRSLCRGSARP